MTWTHEQALMLCELACTYVAERDVDSYQPPEERERIAALRALSGTLMDCCSEFATAHSRFARCASRPLPVARRRAKPRRARRRVATSPAEVEARKA